jgi:hypothetical protein
VASGLATVALANGGQGRRAGAGWAGSAQCSFLSYLLFFLVLCSMKNCDVYELNMCVEIDCCGNWFVWWDEMWCESCVCVVILLILWWIWDEMRWDEMRKQKKRKTKRGGRKECRRANHICTGAGFHPVQMWGICSRNLARYKCAPSFVPEKRYRFNTRYKWGLRTNTNEHFPVVAGSVSSTSVRMSRRVQRLGRRGCGTWAHVVWTSFETTKQV